jgi:hypothetical protein
LGRGVFPKGRNLNSGLVTRLTIEEFFPRAEIEIAGQLH